MLLIKVFCRAWRSTTAYVKKCSIKPVVAPEETKYKLITYSDVTL